MADRRPSLLVTVVATSFGAGFSPKAPGTMGTLTAVPLAWALGRLGTLPYVVGLLAVVAVGTWAAEAFGQAYGTDDDQRIVVDEVAGFLVTLLPVSRGPVELLAAFVLFRLFDIWKPPPVRQIDRALGGGIGVMADDLAAGGYGAIALFTLDRTGVLAWLGALALGGP